MIVLWLLIIVGTLFGALLLLGVWKNRPRRVEIVAGVLCIISLLSSYGMSNMITEREEIIDNQIDNIDEFIDCFDEWVDDFSDELYYVASYEMLECATDFITDSAKTLSDYIE